MIVPYEAPQTLMEPLAAGLTRAWGANVSITPAREVSPDALDRHRNQYASRVFLEELRTLRRSLGLAESVLLLGIVTVDLYIPRMNFIFGEADRGNNAAVVSLSRLRPEFYDAASGDESLLAERLLKEAIHETGHIMGLDHCPDPRCVMHFSNSIGDTDLKGADLCQRCAKDVPQIGDRLIE